MGKCIGADTCLFISSDASGIIAQVFPNTGLLVNGEGK
jgi:hypothetical protein